MKDFHIIPKLRMDDINDISRALVQDAITSAIVILQNENQDSVNERRRLALRSPISTEILDFQHENNVQVGEYLCFQSQDESKNTRTFAPVDQRESDTAKVDLPQSIHTLSVEKEVNCHDSKSIVDSEEVHEDSCRDLRNTPLSASATDAVTSLNPENMNHLPLDAKGSRCSKYYIELIADDLVETALHEAISSLMNENTQESQRFKCASVNVKGLTNIESFTSGISLIGDNKKYDGPDIDSIAEKLVEECLHNALHDLSIENFKYIYVKDTNRTDIVNPTEVIYAISKDCDDEIELGCTFLASLFDQELPNSKVHKQTKRHFTKNKKLSKKARKEKKAWKLAREIEPNECRPSFEEMGFWTEADLNKEIPSAFICPVCLEVLYNPYSCLPCEHTFCEMCLRRVAKYNVDNKMEHMCPICRSSIVQCVPNEVVRLQLITSHGYEYKRRVHVERGSKYRSCPLPASPPMAQKHHVLAAIMQRQRAARQSAWRALAYVPNVLICSVAPFLVLSLLLFSLRIYEHDHWLVMLVSKYLSQIWNYHSLESSEKVIVTNQSIVILTGMSFICSACYVIWNKLK